MRGVAVQIDGYDPVEGKAVTLRAASHDLPDICSLDGKTWWPAIATLPKLRYDLFDGSFAGQIAAPAASMSLSSEPWPLFARYGLADAQVSLWTGEIGQPWSAWTLRLQGRSTARPQIKDGRAELSVAVDDRWLDTALLAAYAGTTKAEGPAALKGLPKPLALGAPRYAPGTLIDSINSVFQVSGYGPIRQIEAALEKAIRYGAPIADYPNYDALVAATIPRGSWATALAVGMARFGAPPEGKVSFLLQGDQAGPDGWARLPGQIIRRLALLAGGAGRIDDASLNALDAARPYQQSIYLDEQTTAREMIQRIAASVNAVAGVSWTGKLFVLPVELRAPSLTLAADGSALPPVGRIDQLEIDAPWKRLAVQSERTWAVHDLSEVAFTAPLIDRGRFDPAETYREGNIVDLADGSRWLFVGTTPAKGEVPGAGSVVWSSMAPPTAAADIKYGDGSTLEAMKPAEPGSTNSADPNSPFGPDSTVQQALTTLRRIDPLGLAVIDQEALTRQRDRDIGRMSEALMQAVLEANHTREILRDAGVAIDPATGTVRIYGIDQTSEQVARVEVALDATKSSIRLLATSDYVDAAILRAQLDPTGQVALDKIIARLTSAEIEIDGLEARLVLKADATTLTTLTGTVTQAVIDIDALQEAIALKASRTEVDRIDTRVSAAELKLSTLGDVTALSLGVRQARYAADTAATGALQSLLTGDEQHRRQLRAAGEARQELAVDLARDRAASASFQQFVTVEVGDTKAAVERVDRARIEGDRATAESIEQVSAALGTERGRITQTREVLIGPDGTTLRALTALDANGRIVGVVQTATGARGDYAVVSDTFAVVDPVTGEALFYVDKDGAIAASFKRSAIGYDNLEMGAAQRTAWYPVQQDVAVGRGVTVQIVSLTFDKIDADSALKICFYGNIASPDDLQFSGAIAIDSAVVQPVEVNIVLDTGNSAGRMPITPFAFVSGIAAGRHTVTFTLTNTETDNVPLTVRAGSTLEVTELRKASLGSVTGSGAIVVSPGGGGTGGGTGSGGGYNGGGGIGGQPINQQ